MSLTLGLITDVLMELLTGHFSLSLVFKCPDTAEKLLEQKIKEFLQASLVKCGIKVTPKLKNFY